MAAVLHLPSSLLSLSHLLPSGVKSNASLHAPRVSYSNAATIRAPTRPRPNSLSTPFLTGGGAGPSGRRRRPLELLAPPPGGGGGGALAAQMNVFSRVARIFRSAVEVVVAGNEDPERLLEQATIEMSTDLAKLRQTTAQVLASKRILEDKYTRAAGDAGDWYRKAKLALSRGDETLAKEALKRKKTMDDGARALKAQLDQQTAVTERIVSSSRILEAKIAEARNKKDFLKSRAQSAKTSKYITEMVASIDTTSALAAYERMEEKVQRLEAESDALTQISTDNLSSRFAELESADVGDDLAALKRELAGGGDGQVRGELPSAPGLPLFETQREGSIFGT